MSCKTVVLSLLMGCLCYAPNAFATEPNDYIIPGKSYLLEGTLSGLRLAYETFDNGINDQGCPDCSTNRELIFLHALTRTAMLFIDGNDVPVDSFLELAQQFGITLTGDYFLDVDDLIDVNDLVDVNVALDANGYYQIPPEAPNAVEIGEIIHYSIIPEINDIIGELDSISDSPSDRFRIFFEPNQTGLQDNLEVDYGEVLILKGLLLALKGQLGAKLAYDVFVDVNEVLMHKLLYEEGIDVNDGNITDLFAILDVNDPNNPSINEDFLNRYPYLLTVLPTPGHDEDGAAILAQGAQDWINGMNYYFDAIDYIRSEDDPPGTDPQEDELLYIDPNDKEVLDNINARLTTLRDSLINDTIGTYPWETGNTYYLEDPCSTTTWELTLNYDIVGLPTDEPGSFIASDGDGTPTPWEVTDISIDGNEIILEMDYDIPGYWGGALFTGILSDDGNSITNGTFEYWGTAYGTLYNLSGHLISTEVVERQLDPNPIFGSSNRYPDPLNPRDLLPEFDYKNMPISGTFGHELGDDPTLGWVLPGMTQEEWAILFDLPVPGLRFYEQLRLAAGDSPRSVALGDLNGDGLLDIVTANTDSNDVSVLLGLGDGNFHEQSRFGVGHRPESVVLGDVNGDGVLDIIAANSGSDDISVLLGIGNGSFQEQARFSVGYHPVSVALGDLNGDGMLDVVTVNYYSADISVLLGLGDGSFRPQAIFGVGYGPHSVALGDLNGDGILDVVTADSWSNTISVLLGVGDGSFQPQATFDVGSGPHSITLSDLNLDGVLDVVTANLWSNDISVLLGKGDGGFQTQVRFDVGAHPHSLSLGDVNGDGVLDVVTVNGWNENISVLLGVGDGSFGRPSIYDVGNDPQSAALGDLNGDGILDIVTANVGPSDVAVFINRSIIFGHWPFGIADAPVDAIRIRFPHDMNTLTFSLEDDIVSFVGPQGTIDANSYEWLNLKTLEIRFEPQSACGIYELVIGPEILDTLGQAMNVDHDSVLGEVPDDRYVATFNLPGPKIVAHAPSDTVIGPVRSLRLNFNRDMDPNSFTPAEDIVSFTGPLGAIVLTGHMWLDYRTLELSFNTQWAPGTYQMFIGPQILDLAGNPLDIDGDFTAGEVPDDQYAATFNIPIPSQIGLGETISASIDYFLEIDAYTFTADVNDRVLVRMSRASGSLGPQILLYAADGNEVARAYSYGNAVEISQVVAVDGAYTILAYDYAGTRTGGYSIFIQRLNSPSNGTAIEFGKTASGSIDSVAEMDTYIFSAEANDTVLVRMSSASDSLVPQIRLYAPDGIELTETYSDENAAEISHVLPADGNYTVLACDYWGTRTGPYGIFLQRLNNPGNETPINSGDTLSGSINSIADANTYTFAATADDIVLITMNRTSGSLDPQARLYAPDGTKLTEAYSYGNAVEISHVLANDGEHTALACDYGGTYTGSYNLSLNVISVEQLTPGDPCTGNISTTDFHLFLVEVATDKNLLVTLEPLSTTGTLELYGRYNQVLTQYDYDHVTKKKNVFGNYELLLSPTQSGTYYFGVYGRDIDGIMGYKITASTVDRHVSDIYPRTVSSSMRSTVHIMGLGFTNGMQAELRSAGEPNIPAETVVLSSPGLIIAHFDPNDASSGLYDISIIWPDDYEKTVEDAIEVKELKEGALYAFDVNMITGGTLTYDITIPETNNLFVTLQKPTLISYGNSWWGNLSLLRNGGQIASVSGRHDNILHIIDPNAGAYTISVTANQTGSGILAVWTSLPELPLGDWVVGQIHCSYGSVYYQVDVPPNQDTLYFEGEGIGLWSHFDIYYGEYGSSQHWVSPQAYDDRRTSIEIPNPAPGLYIVEFLDSAMLYGVGWGRYSADQSRDVLIKASTTFTVEPPPVYLPMVASISTDRGGNTGLVTVEIKGAWLDPNATVSLIHQDYNDIVAENVYGDPDGTALTATFDLKDKEPGEWNLVVANPDGQSVTAASPFTIEEGGEPKLWVEIIGREKIRVGVPTTYVIRYGNRGTADAVGVPVWIAGIPSEATIELGFDIAPLRIQVGPNTVDLSQIPVCLDIDGETVIPLIVPRIPSDSTGTLQITITAPATLGQFQLRAWVAPPFYSSPLSPALIDCIRDVVTTVANLTPGVDCLLALFDAASKLFAEEWVGVKVFSYSEMFGRILVQCSGELIPHAQIPELVRDIVKTILSVHDIAAECSEAFEQILGTPIFVTPVTSATPEDKYGPTGYDPSGTAAGDRKRFVSAERDFYYKVDFWNKEDATAPAYYVLVKDQLDSDLDWGTFRFEKIGFLRWDVELEPCQYFNLNVDMRPDMDLIVDVGGTFDPCTGEINWTFHSLDPATMETPEDPMAGFLPPYNPETGYEIGWVEFSVEPKSGLMTGTQIADQAFVEFDFAGDINDHPAPKEGPWVNTIDSGDPNSYVLPLPATITEPNFLVEWTGQDDVGGSGIAHYDIYVSTDGNEYTLWLDNTSDTNAAFAGEPGHTYAYYSIATDNVGNIELAPAQPDAIAVFNRPPVANAGADQIVECACNTAEGTKVTLNGTGSYDPDDDTLSYTWTGPFVETDVNGPTPTVALLDGCPGDYVITLVVNDGEFDSEPDEVVITVQDTTPPELTLSVTPDTLWPPNHKMVQITSNVVVSDNCDDSPEVSLISIVMNEGDETNTSDLSFDDTFWDGHTMDDIQLDDQDTIYLRAERSGTGTGRVYTIKYQAVDDSENVAIRSATVTVPHNQP